MSPELSYDPNQLPDPQPPSSEELVILSQIFPENSERVYTTNVFSQKYAEIARKFGLNPHVSQAVKEVLYYEGSDVVGFNGERRNLPAEKRRTGAVAIKCTVSHIDNPREFIIGVPERYWFGDDRRAI